MAIIALLVSAVLLGVSEARFQCRRYNSSDDDTDLLLSLQPILSLETVCLSFCKQSNCSSDDLVSSATRGLPLVGNGTGGLPLVGSGTGGLPLVGGATGGLPLVGNLVGSGVGTASNVVGGAAQCVINPKGDGSNPNKVTLFQSCFFPCILDLNLLDTCDVQAIVATLATVCPDPDLRALCVSACLCCGDEDKPLSVCVNACLSTKGVDVNAKVSILEVSVPVVSVPDVKSDEKNHKKKHEKNHESPLRGLGIRKILGLLK